jgi:hypothetical protein
MEFRCDKLNLRIKNKTEMKKINKTSKFRNALWKLSNGLSVFISVVIITLVALFSIGVATMVTDATRQAGNVRQGTLAYYGAEAGLEQALWVNKKLSESTTGGTSGQIGANTAVTNLTNFITGSKVSFEISGTTSSLASVAQKVNDKYIIPFPWTGDVPWHGDGSAPVVGGCSPDKPPMLTGSTTASKSFTYKDHEPALTDPAIEHPCNWGRLAVGQKVAIPLFGKSSAYSTPYSFNNIVVRLRAPCENGKEYCMPSERMELNCWDKGTGEKKCSTFNTLYNDYRGEVVVLWQINADKTTGTVGGIGCNPTYPCSAALKPNDSINMNNGYSYRNDDSQFYEQKINNARQSGFVVLSTLTSPFPPLGELPWGKDVMSGIKQTINSFLTTSGIVKPVLSLSVVSSLVGCTNKPCSQADSPSNNGYVAKMVPYLEYQVQILDTMAISNPPVNKDNIITAESQSGSFTQTIQVKVPNDSTSLEYVIQQ